MTHARAVWAETLLHHMVEGAPTGLFVAQRCGKFSFWYDSSKVANFAIIFCNYFTSTMDVRHIRGMKRKLMTEVLWIQFFNGLLLILRVE